MYPDRLLQVPIYHGADKSVSQCSSMTRAQLGSTHVEHMKPPAVSLRSFSREMSIISVSAIKGLQWKAWIELLTELTRTFDRARPHTFCKSRGPKREAGSSAAAWPFCVLPSGTMASSVAAAGASRGCTLGSGPSKGLKSSGRLPRIVSRNSSSLMCVRAASTTLLQPAQFERVNRSSGLTRLPQPGSHIPTGPRFVCQPRAAGMAAAHVGQSCLHHPPAISN